MIASIHISLGRSKSDDSEVNPLRSTYLLPAELKFLRTRWKSAVSKLLRGRSDQMTPLLMGSALLFTWQQLLLTPSVSVVEGLETAVIQSQN